MGLVIDPLESDGARDEKDSSSREPVRQPWKNWQGWWWTNSGDMAGSAPNGVAHATCKVSGLTSSSTAPSKPANQGHDELTRS
jgi:hypothetical protein